MCVTVRVSGKVLQQNKVPLNLGYQRKREGETERHSRRQQVKRKAQQQRHLDSQTPAEERHVFERQSTGQDVTSIYV